ncbi:MAG: FAD:protein FMN transferase [Pseudomonadota bacterium]
MFAGLALALGAPDCEAGWHNREAALMGTRVRVGLHHDDAAAAEAAIDAALAEIDRIEQLMSTYIETSEISAANRDAASGPVVVGAELFELIRRSLEFSGLTGGAFDITYDSVGQHYDFRERRRPDDATIEAGVELIDHRLVTLDEARRSVAFARPGVRMNLGGIAKGYAVERAAATIAAHGIDTALVSAGGDTRLLGTRLGQPWIIGIQNPRDSAEVAVRLPLTNEAVSTSGDYERFFEEDGQRYHHIVSPETGRPVTGVRSATVIGPDGVSTDALSTAVFVLGPDRGLALIDSLPDYEAVVIDDRQRLRFSGGLADPAAE